MKSPERLAFHGIVIRTADPAAAARRWIRLAGFPVLRRSRREIVLGAGPELFVILRRGRREVRAEVAELHLAVEKISSSAHRGSPDALGGKSWSRDVENGIRLVVRELEGPPSRRWKRPRKPV